MILFYNVANIYVEPIKKWHGTKEHVQVLLRETYRVRERGTSRVKHRTLLNLMHYTSEIQQAIAVAVAAAKEVLEALAQSSGSTLTVGETRTLGAVWCIARVAQKLGIRDALGRGHQVQWALW